MTAQEIEEFEDYLADVLMVWDCYEQKWVDDSPIILRFENQDVLAEFGLCAEPQMSFLHSEKDLGDIIGSFLDGTDRCLCWLQRDIDAMGIGERISIKQGLDIVYAH